MDPIKFIGKVKEQVCMEHKSRRNYPIVWNKIADAQINNFYNQDEINKQILDKQKLQDLSTFEHNNKGDSYFTSPEMHKALVATCRCGRPKRGLHMAKCLQRCLNPYLAEEQQSANGELQKSQDKPVPRTSNSYIGFLQMSSNYRKLEQSMRYISPTHTMPGPRVTTAPYNAIIIG